MDRGAWWAIAHGVTRSQTRLKRLSDLDTHRELRPSMPQDAGKKKKFYQYFKEMKKIPTGKETDKFHVMNLRL